MNPGRIAAVLYDAAVWFFILSAFVFPVLFARWKARERADAEATEEALSRTRSTTSHQYEQDAM
jgi:hypothetical protein